MNWKPYFRFVKVNQLLVAAVGVAVGEGKVPVGVGVIRAGDGVKVGVGVSPGSPGVKEGTGETTGVGVGVVVLPRTTRFAATEGSSVRTLSPFETRALQSMTTEPVFRPVRLNVNAVPLVVALLSLLPAIATMKLPFCGPLIATAGSGPNNSATEMLLTSTRLASYVQVNSALVKPSAGTLFKLTVASAVSPTMMLPGVTTVDE